MKHTHTHPKKRRGLSMAAIVAALAVGNAHAQLEDGLLSYWDFENDFLDSAADYSVDSTVADNGTGGSAVVFASGGQLGTYGDFERTGLGAENVVRIADSADLVAAGESLTISAWFRVDAFDQNWQALIAHGENTDYRIARRNNEAGLGFAGGVGDIPGANISPAVNDGQWHHVVAITEAGVSARLWIDGSLVATSAAAANLTDNGSGELFIGGNPQGDAALATVNQYRPWNGGIDDVALWNRVLTNLEIQDLYAAGNGGVSLGDLLNPEDGDNDTLPDAWEIANGLDPNDDGSIDINNGPNGDPDNDQLLNKAEHTAGTDPQDDDSDDDFSLDGEEAVIGTIPTNPDTDGDSLLDGHETNTAVFVSTEDTGTDPLVSDLTTDSDLDGLFNVWEINNGLEPFDDGTLNPDNGAAGDPDADESSNLDEQTNGTDPRDDDSDDDFSLDGAEATNGTNPLNPDSDGDSLLDGYETNNGLQSYVSETDTGTDPLTIDTDLDGYNDDAEIALGTDPTDPDSSPDASTLPIFDDFEGESLDLTTWSTITGTISQNAQGTVLGGTIAQAGGNIEFGSRGYLYTSTQFDPEVVGGLEISGELSFLSAQDVVSVLTRCDATPLTAYGEANSGIQFVLNANGDTINITARNGDHTVSNVIVTGTIDFLVNRVYQFTVVDDGLGNLSLVVTDKDDPALTISATAEVSFDTSDSNHVVVYNREGNRNTNLHELAIRSVAIAEQAEITSIKYDPSVGVGGTFTLTWNSQAGVTYAIYKSPDLIDWNDPVDEDIEGEDGSTSVSFPNPGPGKTFFRVEPPR